MTGIVGSSENSWYNVIVTRAFRTIEAEEMLYIDYGSIHNFMLLLSDTFSQTVIICCDCFSLSRG